VAAPADLDEAEGRVRKGRIQRAKKGKEREGKGGPEASSTGPPSSRQPRASVCSAPASCSHGRGSVLFKSGLRRERRSGVRRGASRGRLL
jgi:hypothetical protein